MSAENPRFYKWCQTVSCDLGTMPFEGDWTLSDRIYYSSPLSGGGWSWNYYYCNSSGTEFGRSVKQKDSRGRIRDVWQAGVKIPEPHYEEIGGQQVQVPIYFCYCGDDVCVAKLPNGEEVELVET